MNVLCLWPVSCAFDSLINNYEIMNYDSDYVTVTITMTKTHTITIAKICKCKGFGTCHFLLISKTITFVCN